jgi:UrcA family protein
MSPFLKSPLCLALLASTLGFAASSASAQEYGPSGPGYQSGPPESVEVIAPRFHADSTRLNAPLEKVSLSVAVPYDDLDLRTRQGAGELRWRIRDQARQICASLADAYPVYKANGTSCYKTAVDNGLVRADEVIGDARIDARRYSYDAGY